jgi:ABC-type Fe3+/spermidine/putrescine transport system ATPase subunit
MSHRIAIMNHGRIEQVGTPRELYDRPRSRFVASFLGEANLFDVAEIDSAHSGGLTVRTVQGYSFRSSQKQAPSGTMVACVRPEQIALSAAQPRQDRNGVAGTVTDITHAAGSVRTRLRLPCGMVLTHRMQSDLRSPGFEVGTDVHASWSEQSTQLIADAE